MQARFWIGHPGGGLVRIKLNAGYTLTHHYWTRTDEGWSSESNTYSFDGDFVVCDWSADGVDCDGRLSSYGTSHCAVDKLSAGYQEGDIAFPAWEQGYGGQRDYSAEAMGY